MKIILILFAYLSISGVLAQDPLHDGECVEEGSGLEETEKLLSAMRLKYSEQTLSPEFCGKIRECYGYPPAQENEDPCAGYSYTANVFYNKSICGLSRQEYLGLNQYMGSMYTCLNRALYTGKGDDFSILTKTINSALEKFPRYEGFVFRGSYLPKDIVAKHKVGEVIEYPAFTSTSTNQGVSEGFSGGGQMFLIYSKNGRPIMGLMSGENEVLFKAGTKFKVLKSVSGSHFIMREVVPGESRSKAKKEDQKVLALAQEASKKEPPASKYDFAADTWNCPIDPHNVPKVLTQKNVPHTREFISVEKEKGN